MSHWWVTFKMVDGSEQVFALFMDIGELVFVSLFHAPCFRIHSVPAQITNISPFIFNITLDLPIFNMNTFKGFLNGFFKRICYIHFQFLGLMNKFIQCMRTERELLIKNFIKWVMKKWHSSLHVWHQKLWNHLDWEEVESSLISSDNCHVQFDNCLI